MEKKEPTLNLDIDRIDGLEAISQFLDILTKKASQFRSVNEDTGEVIMSAYLLKVFKGYHIYLIDDKDRQSKYLAIYDKPLQHSNTKTLGVGYLLCKKLLDKIETDETKEEFGILNQLMAVNILLFSYYPVAFIPKEEIHHEYTLH